MADALLVNAPPELQRIHTTVIVWYEEGVGIVDPYIPKREAMVRVHAPPTKKIDFVITSREPDFQPERGTGLENYTTELFQYTVEAEPATFILRIHEDEIADDTWGVHADDVRTIGQRSAERWYRVFARQFHDFLSTLCYTGQPFFTPWQPVNGKDDAKGFNPNLFDLPLTRDNFRLVRAEMRGYQDEAGQATAGAPTHLIVPPSLEGSAEVILKAERNEFGASNVDRDKCELVVLDDWENLTVGVGGVGGAGGVSSSNSWALINSRGFNRAFGYVEKLAPRVRYIGPETKQGGRYHVWDVRVRDALAGVRPQRAAISNPNFTLPANPF